jgi:imidazoleglycerol phosphate synthase glutamine amidotransferase subunit HisH
MLLLQDGKPYFGMCLALQLLFEGSGNFPGRQVTAQVVR